jgi:hypothetical protein
MHFMGLLSHRNRLVIFIIEFCSKKKTMRHLPKFILIIALASATPLYAQDSASIYKPVIDGTVRAKYEYQPQISAGRFEVRNARFSVGGKLAKQVAYKAEIDLSEEGQHQDARRLYLLCSYEALGLHDRTDARAFHHRCPPLASSAVFCQPLLHRQTSGKCA